MSKDILPEHQVFSEILISKLQLTIYFQICLNKKKGTQFMRMP